MNGLAVAFRHPARTERGLLPWWLSIVLIAFLALLWDKTGFDRDAGVRRTCLSETTLAHCQQRKFRYSQADLLAAYALEMDLEISNGPAPPGLQLAPIHALTGQEEAALLLDRSGESQHAWLISLIACDESTVLARLGRDTVRVDTSSFEVVPLGLPVQDVERLPSERLTFAGLLVLISLFAPVVLSRIFLGPVNLRRKQRLPEPLFNTVRVLASVLRTGSAFVGWGAAVLGVVGIVDACSRSGTGDLDGRFWLGALLATYTLYFLTLAADLLEGLAWQDEICHLNKLFGPEDSSGPTSPSGAASAGGGRVGSATLQDREILRTINDFSIHYDGRGVLPELGIQPPELPLTLVAPAGNFNKINPLDDTATRAWRVRLGLDKPAPMSIEKGEGTATPQPPSSGLGRVSEVATAARVMRLHCDGYISVQPHRLILTDLGRQVLALPPLALVEDLPFAIQRAFARAESHLHSGSPGKTIIDCSLLLEGVLKRLILSMVPVAFGTTAWLGDSSKLLTQLLLPESNRGGTGAAGVIRVDRPIPTLHRRFERGFTPLVSRQLRTLLAKASVPPGWDEDEWRAWIRSLPLDSKPELLMPAVSAALAQAEEHEDSQEATKRARLWLGAVRTPKGSAVAIREVDALLSCMGQIPARTLNSEYDAWRSSMEAWLDGRTLRPLLVMALDLIPQDKKNKAKNTGRALHALWEVVEYTGEVTRKARNEEAHDSASDDTTSAVSIRQALHVLWLSRVFVSSCHQLIEWEE